MKDAIEKDIDKTVRSLSDRRGRLQTALESGKKARHGTWIFYVQHVCDHICIIGMNYLVFLLIQDYHVLERLSNEATAVISKADETMAPLTGKKRKQLEES